MQKIFLAIILQPSLALRRAVLLLGAVAALIAISAPTVEAEKQWYPVEVDVWTPPFNEKFQREQKLYTPLDKAQKKWRISVFIPHLKDAYWLGVNFGLIDEARRLGIALSIYAAGGYDRLEVQRRQIEESLKDKPDGLIISAISLDGLNDLVKNANDQGIPVLDLINGISSPLIAARTAVSYWELGHQTGTYLLRLQAQSGKPIKIAWFPGPGGAGWVAAGDDGFRKAIADRPVEILASQFGDTGIAVQANLVEDALKNYADDLDYIVGTSVSAEAAIKILRKHGLAGRIKILGYYYSPGVHRGIRRGAITAAPSDQTVLQARIAVDVMVRVLEKKDHYKHVAPRVIVVDRDNIRGWDTSTTLAPQGFRPIFSINE